MALNGIIHIIKTVGEKFFHDMNFEFKNIAGSVASQGFFLRSNEP